VFEWVLDWRGRRPEGGYRRAVSLLHASYIITHATLLYFTFPIIIRILINKQNAA
jgi:hypothetical protein